MIKSNWLYFIFVLIFISSCTDKIEPLHHPPSFMELPKGFDAFEVPIDNEYTPERWDLGKRLFYDPIMSVDSTLSCASCHKSDLAFSDDVAFSLGVKDRIGTRNAPSLANVGFHPYYTREGGIPTLELQILVPIQEHNEFDFNIVLLAQRMAMDSSYVNMSLAAYDRVPDAYTITRSLSNFQRTLISGYSPYDHYATYGDDKALSDEAIRGMNLFFDKRTNCSTCHDGFNFTNYTFENNGLYLDYEDLGRFRLTGKVTDLARFKVPSLRNIQLTGPYMHDGSLVNLKQVIDHYNDGGFNHPSKSDLIRPLGLSELEKSDLVAFLKSLTDETFVNNPIFKK